MFETVIAAHGFGIFEDLMTEIGLQTPGVAADFSSLIPTYPKQLARRRDEMMILAALLTERGLPCAVAKAAADTFDRVLKRGDLERAPAGADMPAVFRALRSVRVD